MPWTLYIYLLKDVLKLLVLATIVLLVVFSFGAAIKPLNDGTVLGAWDLVRFVGFTMPTMLTLVLPFSAGFSVTMVFCRFVADNETTACLASGISYRTILMPVFALGLTLTLGMLYMSNWVVPKFFRKVAAVVERDVADMIVKSIQSGEAYELPSGVVLYARQAEIKREPPLAANSRHPRIGAVMLRGLVVGIFHRDGRPPEEAIAEAADIHFYREGGRTWLEIVCQSAMAYNPDGGSMRLYPEGKFVGRMALSSRFRDEPDFFTWPQLNRLSRHPDDYYRVQDQKRRLVRVMTLAGMLHQLEGVFSADGGGQAIFQSATGSDLNRLTAVRSEMRGQELRVTAHGGEQVRFHINQDGQVHRTIQSDQVLIRAVPEKSKHPLIKLDVEDNSLQPLLHLEFELPLVRSLDSDQEPIQRPSIETRVRWPTDLATPLLRHSARRLLEIVAVEPSYRGFAGIEWNAKHLDQTIEKMNRKIIGQINLRGATSIATVLLLLTGALLSLKLGRSLPLIVYFWLFMTAMVVMVIIHSGENLVTQFEYSVGTGIAIIWMGNLLLTGLIGILYWIVARR